MLQYPRTPRLVNHFSLGADPEWVMNDAAGRIVFPETRALDTLSAFGCDMCGRLAEARSCSSKFALEVVASLIDALRWMAALHVVWDLNWSALTFTGKDGCGGHVHFGQRKIKSVEALDETVRWLLDSKVFDRSLFFARQEGKYGHWGDVRTKSYGYEYRTLPTWMSSPWQAYLTIVICKLIAHQGKPSNYNPKKPAEGVRELLEQYRYLDDDANIAYKALQQHGMPIPSLKDFKITWGVRPAPPIKDPRRVFVPSFIEPEQQTCEELFEYLTQGKALPLRSPVATWLPVDLPEKFYQVAVQAHSLGHLPDVGMNLISRKHGVQIGVGHEFTIQTSIKLPEQRIMDALRDCVPAIDFLNAAEGNGIVIGVPQAFKDSAEQCARLHDVLQDTSLFPVCHYNRFYNTDWSYWDQPKAATKSKGMIGRKLY